MERVSINNENHYFLKYIEGMEILKAKIDNICKEYTYSGLNPIVHTKFRVKSPESIKYKLLRKGEKNNLSILNDIIGARIVCLFLSDIKQIEQRLASDPDIIVINRKDYITTPKESGYSSYHIIIKFSVSIEGKKVWLPAEIQIRTIAMDMWASLEHKINYKKDFYLPNYITRESQAISEFCSEIDRTLDLINQSINHIQPINSIKKNIIKDEDYYNMLLEYDYALKVIRSKIENINDLYNVGDENPIEHISSRLKAKEKSIAKLEKNNIPVTIENIEKNINDISGVRIVCSFLSDVNQIIDIIKSDQTLIVLNEKDYITTPKESGYASYHLIVGVPLPRSNKIIKVEIQVRTIAMDMWASLEDKLCYQKDANLETKLILKEMSQKRINIDDQMQKAIDLVNKNKIAIQKINSKILVKRK